MIYVIIGPTGSGKTDIANRLSDRLSCPIINADAFQIYQEMNIGTAKISQDDPHYRKYSLLDIVRPDQSFSVKEYQDLFRKTYEKLKDSYPDMIVVGGTGLYIKASLYDYTFSNEEATEYDDLLIKSNEELKKMLDLLDPKASALIHVNNRKRLIRALTIYRNQGLRKSEIIEAQNHTLIYPDVRFLFLNPDREKLYDTINKRVDEMFRLGLVDEVRKLIEKYDLSLTSFQGIGYKEVIAFLNGETDLKTCQELIKKRTRNYAKRQITFFKHQFSYEEYPSKEALWEKLENE